MSETPTLEVKLGRTHLIESHRRPAETVALVELQCDCVGLPVCPLERLRMQNSSSPGN